VSFDIARERVAARGAIGHVELQHARAAAHPLDGTRNGVAFVAMRMAVNDDVEPIGRGAQRDRAADAAAGTCD
jgi:hypothetical protein